MTDITEAMFSKSPQNTKLSKATFYANLQKQWAGFSVSICSLVRKMIWLQEAWLSLTDQLVPVVPVTKQNFPDLAGKNKAVLPNSVAWSSLGIFRG